MGTNTKIHWCNHTFSPWIGCTKISPGCENCYAENMARRFFKGAKWGNHPRVRTSEANWRLPLRWNNRAEGHFNNWKYFGTGKYTRSERPLSDKELIEMGFIKPLRPRVFCGSLCDVFDNSVPAEWRSSLFALIEETPYLDWLLLTKRVGNVKAMTFHDDGLGLPENVWLGITVCNQEEADRDIPKLLEIPAAKRFLSIEPMLGGIDLEKACCLPEYETAKTWDDYHDPQLAARMLRHGNTAALDWVICGGETGAKARSMHSGWVMSLRDQCQEAGTPFFFKQMSKKKPIPNDLLIREFPNV